MDPITLTTAFSTIVGLIVNYVSEKRAEDTLNFDEFMKWLNEHNHKKVVSLLEQNAITTTSIKALLSHNHKDLVERLNSIDELVARVASGNPEMRSIIETIKPNAILSEQALSLIEQINDSGTSSILEFHMAGHVMFQCIEGTGVSLEYSEPRYINDDLETLVEMKLLRKEFNKANQRVFIFTRNAERFVNLHRATRA